MNPSIQKTLEDVGLDALIRESRTIPAARRFELQQRHATGGPNFDMGQFAGLALALRRVEAGAPVEELRELVLAMAEQAFYCRQAQAQVSDPEFRAELNRETAHIESGQATPQVSDPEFRAELNRETAHIESGQATPHEFMAILEEFRREKGSTPERARNGSHGEAKERSAETSEK